MTRKSLRRPRGTSFTCAALLGAMAVSASASSIAVSASPLQMCLDSQFETWVNARAELVVNEDPSAGDIDDASVARWAVETMTACRAQAGGPDQAAEAQFTKRAARWHQHIYDRVQSIRELTRPD